MRSPRVLGTLAVSVLTLAVIGGCTDDGNDTDPGDNPGGVPGVEDQGYLDTSLPAITDPQMTPAPNPAAGGDGAPAPDDAGTGDGATGDAGSGVPTGTTVP